MAPATRILGFGRRKWFDADWVKEVAKSLRSRVRGGLDEGAIERFAARLHFVSGDLQDPDAHARLRGRSRDDTEMPTKLVFYLSVSPEHYGEVADRLSALGPAAPRLLLAAGVGLCLTVGLATTVGSLAFLEYPRAWSGVLILLIESAATLAIATTLALAYIGRRPECLESASSRSAPDQRERG